MLIVFGGFVVSLFPGTGAPEALLIGVPVVALGGAWAWRIGRLRTAYDESDLHVVGWLRSITIPRARVRRVDTDPRTARVDWEREDGSAATTPLSVIAVGNSYALPISTLKNQRAFLSSLQEWAQGH